MLKTISKDEALLLKNMLPDYYFHLKRNPDTLMTRFFGFHKIIMLNKHSSRGIYFVVMGNAFNTHLEIHERYDLKGSTIGRSTDEREDRTVARKDLDFNKSGKRIFLGTGRKRELMR